MHYRLLGNPRAEETFVLIHGNGLSSATWEPLVPFLGRHRILLPDLPGHGKTPPSPRPPGLDELSGIIGRLLKRLGIDSCHLLGHAFGGNVAVRLALQIPETIRSLILLSPVGYYPQEAVCASIRHRRSLIETGGLRALAEHMVQLISVMPRHDPGSQLLVDCFLQTDLSHYLANLDLFMKISPLDELKRLAHPVQVMAGEDDTLFPPYLSAVSSSFIRQSKFVTVSHASNMMFYDNPAATADKITDFLASLGAGHICAATRNPYLPYVQQGLIRVFSEGKKRVEPERKLSVKLLGTFRVEVCGQEVTDGWNLRHAKRLLLYLIMHPGCTREMLYDEFWPELELRKAQNLLRVSLNHLKQLLDPLRSGDSFLQVDREHIYLSGSVECDLLEWMELVHASFAEKIPALKKEKARELLMRLPRTLLPGFSDDWFLRLRDSIERKLLSLAEWMLASAEKVQDVQECLEYCLALLPLLGEEAGLYAIIVKLYLRLNRTNEADLWQSKLQNLA